MQELHLIQGEHKHLIITDVSGDTAQWQITQEADSVLTVHVFSLDTRADMDTSVIIDVRHLGEHAETYIYGVGVIIGNQRVRVRTHVVHNVPDCTSRQLLKFAVKDEAMAEFVGELIVAPHAQHTEAMQTNRNVLLSPKATMHTQPQLEIYADDVKCSHGATTGQIDESALFYMQQRGIAADEARQLLLTAFFHDVLTTLGEPDVEERLQKDIAEMIR